jgi:putative transposase
VLNRGNGRMRIFHKQADYAAFVAILLEGLKHAGVELLAYCLMPNHWTLSCVRERARIWRGTWGG